MRLALFGPPGAGKGTQADLLVERYHLKHISTGVMIRAAMAAESPAGLEARAYVVEGKLVPGRLVRRLAEDAIKAQGFNHYVLDGYPRTVEQAEWLTEFLEEQEIPLQAVLNLVVPDELIVERLSQRRVNKETGENYHLTFNPPPPEVPAALVVQRPDDTPEAIRKRLKVYKEETAPVEAFYRRHEIVFDVDGVGSLDEVAARIDDVVRPFAEGG